MALFPVLFFSWKAVKKTKWKKPHEIDLKGEVEEIEHYTANFVPQPSKSVVSSVHWRAFTDLYAGMHSTSGSISSSAASTTTRSSNVCESRARYRKDTLTTTTRRSSLLLSLLEGRKRILKHWWICLR